VPRDGARRPARWAGISRRALLHGAAASASLHACTGAVAPVAPGPRERPPRPLTFGVGVDPAGDPATVSDAMAGLVGHRPTIIGTYLGWPYGGVDAAWVRAVRGTGALPMVTWEPWDYRQPTRCPFPLADIADGRFDGYVIEIARQVAALGEPILLRFAHEMNGSWYPWALGAQGARAEDYIGAWRHLVEIFRRTGAGGTRWVWCPNVERVPGTGLTATHPGAEWVDVVALDGYNGGTAVDWGGWTAPDDLFGPSLREVRRVAGGRPVILAEVGCAEQGGSKADWVGRLFSWLAGEVDVAALVWFEEDRHADWRIGTSGAAARAVADGLSAFRAVGPEGWLGP
jgi:mannan endo-1,4-beta-mannosidase